MARISELEQRNSDTLEVAISDAEYSNLGSGTQPFELRVTILDGSGNELSSFLLSTDPADWVLNTVSGEYVLIEPLVGIGNHRTDWDGLVLSSTNDAGLDTVEDALMVGPFDEPVDADGPLATIVASATHIPVGTPLDLIDQSNVEGSGVGATLRFDAPDVDTPIVSRVDDLGDTGTAPPVCFVSGTQIACQTGHRPIETLKAGDRVLTLDHGPQTIRWIGKIRVSSEALKRDDKLRPVRIGAGAFGGGLPKTDLRLSRQHRVVVSSSVVQKVAKEPQVLIAAHRLKKVPKISIVAPKQDIEYHHILLDKHEIVFANGLPCESLLLGEQTRKMLCGKSLLEIEELGVFVDQDRAAKPIPSNIEQNELATQLVRSGQDLYSHAEPDLGPKKLEFSHA